MTDLFDEMGKKSSEKVSEKVTQLGGDLLDELAIKSKKPELLSQPIRKITQGEIDEERQRLINELNADMSTFDKFLVGAGRGLKTIGRGLGIADQEDEATKRAFKSLADDSLAAQAGEIVGQSAPFIAAAPLSGAGLVTSTAGRSLIPAAQSTLGRIAGTGILGAAEGGVISSGLGGSADDVVTGAGVGGAIGAGMELVIPAIGKLASKIYQKLGRSPRGPLLDANGAPTPEFEQALADSGTTFEDLTNEAFATVNKQNIEPVQAARKARFESLDIPSTAGDITQDFKQQAKEQRLLSQAASESGEPLRQLKLNQSEAFKSRVNELIDSLGIPDEAGDNIKDALMGRKSLIRSEKNQFYQEAFDKSPELAGVPIVPDTIIESMADNAQKRRISRLSPTQTNALDDLLVEFGLDASQEAVEAFDGQITPLSAGNFEDFRQALNQIERSDQSGAIKVLTGPIKNALDAETALIDDAIKRSGITDSAVLDLFKAARDRTKTLKTEFSPQSIAGRLIDVKRDGVTPVIEASKVSRSLLSQNAPIEELQRTLSSLRKSGEKGARGIKDLQASVILNALNDALSAPSRKTSGIETIGGNQFAKSLNKFGDAKLKELFKGDEKSLNRLLNLKQTALDMSPEAAATPKGSAPVILDIMQRTGNLPGLAAIRDTINFVIKAGADDRAVRKAMDSSPKYRKVIGQIQKDFPAIATALGVSMASNPEGNE